MHCGVQGSGASPEGNKPFIDVLDVDSGETQRIWQSKPPFYESTGARFVLRGCEKIAVCHCHASGVRHEREVLDPWLEACRQPA